jgi:hypothetical protein
MGDAFYANAALAVVVAASVACGWFLGRAYERRRCAAICRAEAVKQHAEADERERDSPRAAAEARLQALVASDLACDIRGEVRDAG